MNDTKGGNSIGRQPSSWGSFLTRLLPRRMCCTNGVFVAPTASFSERHLNNSRVTESTATCELEEMASLGGAMVRRTAGKGGEFAPG